MVTDSDVEVVEKMVNELSFTFAKELAENHESGKSLPFRSILTSFILTMCAGHEKASGMPLEENIDRIINGLKKAKDNAKVYREKNGGKFIVMFGG